MKKIFLSSLLINLLILSPTLAATSLPVPFTAQAPYGQWTAQPWADACEEAVTVMLTHFYNGNNSAQIPAKVATADINKLVGIENWLFGYNKDTNAQQMTQLINEYLPWRATVVEYPSFDAIKNEIAAGRPVIALVHGRALANPYFRAGGPDYHTVIIKGFDDDKQAFITQEPGVNRGLDYPYSYDTLMNALHDFVPGGKTINGTPTVLFTDLPTLESGTLVKLGNDPGVYYLLGQTKYPITSEQAFLTRGWKWTQIRILNPDLLGKFTVGDYLR